MTPQALELERNDLTNLTNQLSETIEASNDTLSRLGSMRYVALHISVCACIVGLHEEYGVCATYLCLYDAYGSIHTTVFPKQVGIGVVASTMLELITLRSLVACFAQVDSVVHF
jgi:hypothetical protein